MIGHLAILGSTGDLTRRLLLPSVAALLADDRLPVALQVSAIGRRDWDTDRYLEWLLEGPAHLSAQARDDLRRVVRYRRADLSDPTQLRAALAPLDRPLAAYLALPPALFARAIETLAAVGLPRGSRVVVEKPFGSNLTSARELNRLLHAVLSEDSVYRIDHFLHKQTVQNLLGLRFANRVFEPLWSHTHIERIEIIWDETLGIEGRAGYYDRAGALLDMIQNHLLQLLALVAMERPASLHPRDLRDRKVELLRAIRRLDPAELTRYTRRARYTAGRVGRRRLSSYVDEPGVDPSRNTETFAELQLPIDNPRWTGTTFRLRTGKALGKPRRAIEIHFRHVRDMVFAEGSSASANLLRLKLEPDTMSLRVNVNGAGDPFALETVELDAQLAVQDIPAYGRLLLGVLEGDPAFSIRDDEAEEAWRVIEPVLEGWRDGMVPLGEYRAGSGGPIGAIGSAIDDPTS